MARRLVVVRESLAGVADLVHPFGDVDPFQRRRGGRGGRERVAVRGPQGIGPEDVLDVREQQLLVLLLVVQAERDEAMRRVLQVAADAAEESRHRRVDLIAVVEHLLQRGPGGEPALGAAVPLAGLHVIGVEEERVARVGGAVGRVVVGQHERLEEPRGVGQVPLGR